MKSFWNSLFVSLSVTSAHKYSQLGHSSTNKRHHHVLSNLSNLCTLTNSESPPPALRDFSQLWVLGNNLYSAATPPEWDQVPGWAQELCFMWWQDNSIWLKAKLLCVLRHHFILCSSQRCLCFHFMVLFQHNAVREAEPECSNWHRDN